jgi:N-acetylmuramoyl-L-alanine amidase
VEDSCQIQEGGHDLNPPKASLASKARPIRILDRRNRIQGRLTGLLLVLALLTFCDDPQSIYSAASSRETLRIVDYQKHLNPAFRKRLRSKTRFIIVHSTESSLPSSLRTLSKGKVRHGRYITRGGHAHFLVARNGKVYRILDPKFWANHAGVSMWDGLTDLSDYSVGVELEGYHNVPFTLEQYRSLKLLLDQLKQRYGIDDRNVLEHYRIAYSEPNRYHQSNARGRKSDPGAGNFDRIKAGLKDAYPQDPDVIAGHMKGSPALLRAGGPVVPAMEEAEEEEEEEQAEVEEGIAISSPRIIGARETAWRVAGVQYNAPTTLYKFPDGRVLRGNQVEDWSDVPRGTEVRLGVPVEKMAPEGRPLQLEKETKVVSAQRSEVVVPIVSLVNTPWKIANVLHNAPFTFYLYPDGSVHSGSTLSDPSKIPTGSKVLVAYHGIPRPVTKNALGEDLEEIYLDPRTLYLFPDQTLMAGDQIQDFRNLPVGLLVFAKLE